MHLWSSYIASDFLFQASRQFQHSHGITVLNELKDYSEIINLATHPENIQILSFYLNQQPILHQLINYVRTHTRKMINKLDDNPFIIPGRHQPHAEQHPYDKLSLDFLKESATFDIQINNITISLSKREAQCLHYLYQGKTSKEIGKALAISHRTIEIYLDQIRTKTHSKNRLELIGKITKSQLENLAIAL
jgi:DNA-binding CsgD family transcriptional regulator